jgi:hypothetical protein
MAGSVSRRSAIHYAFQCGRMVACDYDWVSDLLHKKAVDLLNQKKIQKLVAICFGYILFFRF